jgi:hypothetical protein
MEKGTADLKDWWIETLNRQRFILNGKIENHHQLGDISDGHTGTILRLDLVKMEAETKNTIWKLHK